MELISFLLRRSRTLMVVALLSSVAGGASSAALMALINALVQGGTRGARPGAFVALALAVLATTVIAQGVLARVGQDAVLDLRTRLSGEIAALPLRKVEELGVGPLMAVLTSDVPALASTAPAIPMLFTSGASVVACFAYLGVISWRLLALVVGLSVVGIVSVAAVQRRAFGAIAQARVEENSLQKHFRSLLDGAKELRLHAGRRRVFLDTVLRGSAVAFREHSLRSAIAFAAADGWVELVYFASLGVVLFLGARITGDSHATIAAFVIIALYVKYHLGTLVGWMPAIGRASAAIASVGALGISLRQEKEYAVEGDVGTDARSVHLSGVAHSYHREGEDSTFTLGPLDLQLRRGELVFLVGGNGSGKSTLAKLLTGLYPPEQGEVFAGAVRVGPANRGAYRELFTAVFADFFLFDSLLGLTGADEKRVGGYLAKLQLAHKVSVRDGRLSTTALSTGQRKRLALLAAYLEDRPFYVFDEWASDQDPVFKEVFYTQLLPELRDRDKGVLVITHDDRYFHTADRLLKLEDGQLRETPRALASGAR